MNKKNIPVEFVYQMFALIIAIIVVHAFYVSVVRPNAAQIIEEQNAAAAADPNYIRERRVAVLIKDLEQEACFILMFWALAIMGYKAVKVTRERRLLDVDLVPVAEGMRILPEDTREFARQVQQLPDDQQRLLLPRALMNALRRFNSTHSIQDVSSSVTQSLGVAFNSTFVALLISIFLMFLVYQLQLLQERLVFDTQAYCDDKLIRHMRAD
jgi:hypothetical protein